MMELLPAQRAEAEPNHLAAELRFFRDILFRGHVDVEYFRIICERLCAWGVCMLLFHMLCEWLLFTPGPRLRDLDDTQFTELLLRRLYGGWRLSRMWWWRGWGWKPARFEKELKRRCYGPPPAVRAAPFGANERRRLEEFCSLFARKFCLVAEQKAASVVQTLQRAVPEALQPFPHTADHLCLSVVRVANGGCWEGRITPETYARAYKTYTEEFLRGLQEVFPDEIAALIFDGTLADVPSALDAGDVDAFAARVRDAAGRLSHTGPAEAARDIADFWCLVFLMEVAADLHTIAPPPDPGSRSEIADVEWAELCTNPHFLRCI